MDIDGLIIQWFLGGMGAGLMLGWLVAWLIVWQHHGSSGTQSHSSTGDET